MLPHLKNEKRFLHGLTKQYNNLNLTKQYNKFNYAKQY